MRNSSKSKVGTSGALTMTKVTTDITTPAIPSEDHRYTINDK